MDRRNKTQPEYIVSTKSAESDEVIAARARLKAKQPLLDLQAEEFARANRGQQ